MTLKSYIIRLHKKNIITEKPHPIWVFLLALLAFIIGIIVFATAFFIAVILIAIAIITFIFAILHMIVYLIVKKRKR